ncbi:MAG: J domain-containing protein [Acidimicrobiales bacterium]
MADAGLYERLGVDPDADLAALRAAYRRLARELHPDLHHGGGIETQLRMAMVNEAWAVLSDPERRAAYDAERRRAAAAATAAAAAAERHRSPPRSSGPRPTAVPG